MAVAGWESPPPLQAPAGCRIAAAVARAGLPLVHGLTIRVEAVFSLLAGVTVDLGRRRRHARSPVHCATWFAMTLLGIAGLFLFQERSSRAWPRSWSMPVRFSVTSLFVLMPAQLRKGTRITIA